MLFGRSGEGFVLDAESSVALSFSGEDALVFPETVKFRTFSLKG